MRRVLVACAVVLVVGCGGGGGKVKHPDAAANDDGSNVDQAAGGADAAAGDGASEAGVDGAAGAADVAASTDADGAAGAETGADALDGVADVASEATTDGGSETTTDGDATADGDAAEAPAPKLVTVAFTGAVETVAGTPLGFDSTARLAAVSGSFTYDLRLLDDEPTDPLRGKYQRAGTTAFTMTVKGHTITGSGKAIVETENLDPDTFRFLDGPQGDTVVRTMQVDAVDAPALVLSIAITDTSGAMLTSDALPDPFPTINIADADGGFNISHTFSLKDGGGTLLMQLTTLVSQ
jgi:hypothetical protein